MKQFVHHFILTFIPSAELLYCNKQVFDNLSQSILYSKGLPSIFETVIRAGFEGNRMRITLCVFEGAFVTKEYPFFQLFSS